MNLECFGSSFFVLDRLLGFFEGPIPCAKSSSKQAMPSENVCVRASVRVRLRRSVAVFVAAHKSLVRSCVRVCACMCASMYYAHMNVYDRVHNRLCTCACFLFLSWFVYVCVGFIWERL